MLNKDIQVKARLTGRAGIAQGTMPCPRDSFGEMPPLVLLRLSAAFIKAIEKTLCAL